MLSCDTHQTVLSAIIDLQEYARYKADPLVCDLHALLKNEKGSGDSHATHRICHDQVLILAYKEDQSESVQLETNWERRRIK